MPKVCTICLRRYRKSEEGREQQRIGGAWGKGKWPDWVLRANCQRHTKKGRLRVGAPPQKSVPAAGRKWLSRKDYEKQQDAFYRSSEWRGLRYDTLKKYGRRCMCCGATPENGIQIHVDHIEPISKKPWLKLDPNNLQVLCEDCNLGKSNRDAIDWRQL